MSTPVTPRPASPPDAPGPTANVNGTGHPSNRPAVPDPIVRATATPSSRATRQTPEGNRLAQRISLLLGHRTDLGRMMQVILAAALVFGLIGFAVHLMWVVAVVIIAVGLGYVAANSRRDRSDAVNQRQEDELDAARHN
jgi:Flp pilus assembly protein TadB